MLESIGSWIGLLQTAGAAFCGWVWWSIERRFASKTAHETLERRVAGLDAAVKNLPTKDNLHVLEQRVTGIEGHLKLLPTKDDMHAVAVALTQLSGKVDLVDLKVGSAAMQATRIEEFILKGHMDSK